jgi:hypothetical protein
MRSQIASMQKRIATLEAAKGSSAPPPQAVSSEAGETKSAAEPAAFRFKGLTLTPGGFLNSTALVRTRNENADVATSYSATPLDGSSNANLSELRGSTRNSQLSLLIEGAAGDTKFRGYVETDFLGAAPTANYVQSSEFGRIAYGNQVMYVHRGLWSGIGNRPAGRNVVVYSTLRFNLP